VILRLALSVEHGLVTDRQTHEYGIIALAWRHMVKKMTVLDGKDLAKPKNWPGMAGTR